MLTERFDRALVYASDAHREQVRKGSNVPYVAHLMGVSSIALEFGADEDQAIAALLHDAVEDQGGKERLADIRRAFGDRVAGIVDDCTDTDLEPKPPWRERKEAYLASLSAKPADSLLVSLADKTHNAEAIVVDLERSGDEVWQRFTGKREGTLWYYRELLAKLSARMPAMTGRLAKAVAAMELH